MKALAIDQYGGPDRLQVVDLPTPEAGPGQALVRMHYVSINPADWKEGAGMLKDYVQHGFPYVLGFDGAGVIAALGAGVEGLSVGQKVMFARAVGQHGTWAELVPVEAAQLHILPDDADLSACGAIPTASSTAYQALFSPARGALVRGMSVLIHGGAGGVGTFAIAIAKDAGLKVAATCQTSNVDYVKGLGADRVIDYKAENIRDAAMGWCPEGYDAVIDAVSPATFPDALDVLKPGGRLVSIATLVADGDIEGDIAKAAARGLTKVLAVLGPDDLNSAANPLVDLMRRGVISTPATQVYEMNEAGAALAKVMTGHTRGKLAIRMTDDRRV